MTGRKLLPLIERNEIRRVLSLADLQTQVMILLSAHSGLRLVEMGSAEGNDGLRLGNLPDLMLDGEISFSRTPATVQVTPRVHRRRRGILRHTSFLSTETCETVRKYLKERAGSGEIMSKNSPLVKPPKTRTKFFRAREIQTMVRRTIRRAGYKWSSRALRRRFAALLMIEGIRSEYVFYWMGRTVRQHPALKPVSSPDFLEDMRKAYKRAEPIL